MPEVDYGVALTRMLLSLAACIVLLVISVWFLRRLMQSRFQRPSTSQSIQILEKRMISPKSALYLVEIEGKKVLVAESQLEVKLKFLTEEKEASQPSESEL